MTLVVDAGAITDLLLARPLAGEVERVMTEHAGDLHAPHLIDTEVLSALRRLVAGGHATRGRAEAAIADLRDLPIERYPHDILTPRAWELRDNFSMYDAAYVALAEALGERGVPLLTTDHRMAAAVRAHSRTTAVALRR